MNITTYIAQVIDEPTIVGFSDYYTSITITEFFIKSLFPPSNGYLLLGLPLAICIGLLFRRKFVVIWGFLLLFIVLFLIDLTPAIRILQSYSSIKSYLTINLLYCSFFAIVSFLTSTIGRNIQKIEMVQDTISRAHIFWRIMSLFSLYLLLMSPLVAFDFMMRINISTIGLIIITVIEMIFVTFAIWFIFYRLYNRAKNISQNSEMISKSDYFYFTIVLIFFLVALKLGTNYVL